MSLATALAGAGCSSESDDGTTVNPANGSDIVDPGSSGNASESSATQEGAEESSTQSLSAARPTISWEFRGYPFAAARIAGCKDGSIYALNDDKSIWRSLTGRDGSWSKLATVAAAQDIACADRLWVFHTDRSLHRNDGTPTSLAFTRVGKPSGARLISAGAIGNNTVGLYALNDDNSLWKSATGADGSWTRIGQQGYAARVTGGVRDLWQLKTNKTLWRGNGSDADWRLLDTPSSADIISDDGSVPTGAVWALNTDRNLYRGIVNGGGLNEVCRPNCYGTAAQNAACDRCDTGLACNGATCTAAGLYARLCNEPDSAPACYSPMTCQSGLCYGTGKLNGVCRANYVCDDGLICSSGVVCTTPKAQTNCPAGSRDCNSCATDVATQFRKIFYGANASTGGSWKFNYFDTYPPLNSTPDVLDSPASEHFQSFVHTNDTTYPFAAVHSAASGGGVLGIIHQKPSEKRLRFLHRTQSGHPAGMQALGQFLLYGDGTLVRVFDMATPDAVQTHYLRGASGEAGDGVGAVKMANGDALLVVGPENGSKPTSYRMFVTPSLTTSLQVNELRTVTIDWGSIPSSVSRISENLTVIPECGTGDIYIVNASGDGGIPTEGTWRLSRVRFTSAGPRVEHVNHAVVDQTFSCHLRSSGTVWADLSGRLNFYCHERAVGRGLSEESESVAFSARVMGPTTPPTQPPTQPCCERDANGTCTLYPPVGGLCP